MSPASKYAGRPLRVVVVHWNQPGECCATVNRLLKREIPVNVTIIDNDSTAANLRELQAGIEGLDCVELVETGTNLGFGPGANVGLQRFLSAPDDGDWVALCPHDVDPAPGCFVAMLEAAESEPMAGLMCADVGDGMTPVIDPYFGGMVIPGDDRPGWQDADYPHGTLMLLRRECLDEIGVFDERYFSYCEEADLGLRAQAAGWRIGLIRGARVTNQYVGSSVALVDYLQTRNTLLLVQEMSGWYHAGIRLGITLIQSLRGTLRPATQPLIFDASARMSAIRDFLLRRFGPPPANLRPTARRK